MAQVDALKVVDAVRRRLVDLALSENYVRDARLNDVSRRIWEGPSHEGGLVSELWVEGAFPAEESTERLQSLTQEGLFPADLRDLLDHEDRFPKDRSLYAHQADALRACRESLKDDRLGLVIQAGTGAGKTESFLLPILRDLWLSPRNAQDGGMRCLILYPMNALIADQVERIYQWLKGQSRLTVFHFNSETPNDRSQANKRGVPDYEPCRKRTREEARQSVPDIVVTNYSMLEYMLCRPQDDCFFGPDLRAIVLDEAHLYSGALAAEITLLLRRVRRRCGVEPSRLLQILTSATLGGTESDLRRFAATLFSTSPERVKLIEGRRAICRLATVKVPPAKTPAPERLAQHSELDITTLTPANEFAHVDDPAMEVLAQVCREVSDESTVAAERKNHDNTPAPFLHSVLDKAPITQELAQALYDRQIIALPELAEILWGQRSAKATEATALLLRLAAAARPTATAMPLVPHRLHFLVRGPAGISSCLSPDCTGPDVNRLDPLGCVQATSDRCRFCNSATVPVHRCDNCGEWALSVFQNIQEGRLQPGYFVSSRKRSFYLVSRDRTEGLASVVVDPSTGEYSGTGFKGARLYKAPCPEHGASCNECARQKCPQCDAVWRYADSDTDIDDREGACLAFASTDRLAISVLAETVLHGLPPYGDQSRNWKPGEGRRLLCFSDSRREAARLGPYLTAQHEIWLIRSALARVLRENSTPELADYLRKEVRRLEKELSGPLPEPVRVTVQKQLDGVLTQLQAATVGLPFQQLAQLFAQASTARQLLDPDEGEKHRADRWTQRDWEANARTVAAHAEALIARELDGAKRTQVSLESMGLVEIVYPGLESTQPAASLLGLLPSQSVRTALTSVWPDLVVLVLDTLRSDRSVGWSEETAARKWQGESPLYALWSTRDRQGWSARAFVGDPRIPLHRRSLRLWFTRAVLVRAGFSEEEAEDYAPRVLQHVFDQLVDMANQGEFKWLRCEERQIGVGSSQTGIQLLMDRLAFRTPAALYRCPDTDTLWSRSALDFVPFRGCHGRLVSLEKETVDKDLRWGRPRREVESQKIFHMGLWAEEHSAQLGPDENKRRQTLFKDGIRNILSSTTTMELGIDIGGLNGVLMGNVPPSRANHLQRAGRAGRRTDGSAIVVTYAREQAFDREVFHRFGAFLERHLRRPVVFLDREEFTRRHMHAFLLGLFLSPRQESRVGAMDAYGRMGKFCGLRPPDRWTEQTKPLEPAPAVDYSSMFSSFLDALGRDHSVAGQTKTIVSGTPMEEVSKGLGAWSSFLNEAKRRFSEVVEDWRRDVNSLLDVWREIPMQPSPDLLGSERARANAVRYQIKARCDLTVIECLADGRFLPRYGFPINLQRLSVRVTKDETRERSVGDERYRLERPSILALNEYVPGALVLAGGKIMESRGLLKHWTGENLDQALGLKSWALRCGNDHTYLATSPNQPCRECDMPPSDSGYQLLFPRFGYTTAAWSPPLKWKHLERVGEVETHPQTFAAKAGKHVFSDFGEVEGLVLQYMEEAELLIHNAGKNDAGFAVCTKSGFADSEQRRSQQGLMHLPSGFENHPSIFQTRPDRRCWSPRDQAPVLRNKVLAARENVDLLLFDWPNVALHQGSALFSLGRAILLAGCKLLEIDARELGSDSKTLADGRPGFVIYETAPGGSGHCRELVELGQPLLLAARKILRGTDQHHCERACLDCLLDFAGQFSFERLDRRGALEIMDPKFAN